MTRARAWAATLPPAVWAAVAGLVLLASVGLVLVVGAGLTAWRGGVRSIAPRPVVVVPPPRSGLVLVPSHHAPAPASPHRPTGGSASTQQVLPPAPAAPAPVAARAVTVSPRVLTPARVHRPATAPGLTAVAARGLPAQASATARAHTGTRGRAVGRKHATAQATGMTATPSAVAFVRRSAFGTPVGSLPATTVERIQPGGQVVEVRVVEVVVVFEPAPATPGPAVAKAAPAHATAKAAGHRAAKEHPRRSAAKHAADRTATRPWHLLGHGDGRHRDCGHPDVDGGHGSRGAGHGRHA